jgi:hypothetical protein
MIISARKNIYPEDIEETLGTLNGLIAGRMMRINPTFVVTADLEKLNPYAKFGVIVGIGSIMRDYKYEDDADKYYYKEMANGGIAFEFNAPARIMFNLSVMISIFGKANMVNLSHASTNAKIKEYNHNGVDELSLMNIRQKCKSSAKGLPVKV